MPDSHSLPKKVHFLTHVDSGNRGCEAITESTCALLGLDRENTFIYTEDGSLDRDMGLGQYGRFVGLENSKTFFTRVKKAINRILKRDPDYSYKVKYPLDLIDTDSLAILSGGDLYCYSTTVRMMGYLNAQTRMNGAKTVLWGCSIEKKFLTDDVVRDLKSYGLITVRESLSQRNLAQAGICETVHLIPDTAFCLAPVKPAGLNISYDASKQYVGINISNYVNGGFETNTVFYKGICRLVEHIIESTGMDVILIPHVTWKKQDDRILLEKLYAAYGKTGRVQLLQIERLNYREIRHVISRCRFFFGARTHAVISAYSTSVPSVALGYSLKSAGIAKDLGLDERLVVDCSEQVDADCLVDTFAFLLQNEASIRSHLESVMPNYAKKLDGLAQMVVDSIEKKKIGKKISE